MATARALRRATRSRNHPGELRGNLHIIHKDPKPLRLLGQSSEVGFKARRTGKSRVGRNGIRLADGGPVRRKDIRNIAAQLRWRPEVWRRFSGRRSCRHRIRECVRTRAGGAEYKHYRPQDDVALSEGARHPTETTNPLVHRQYRVLRKSTPLRYWAKSLSRGPFARQSRGPFGRAKLEQNPEDTPTRRQRIGFSS